MILFLIYGKSYSQKPNGIFDLKLKTSDNSNFNSLSIKTSKATVFFFLLTDCPASQNYTLTINQLQKKYSGKNIQFNIVFPDTYSSITEIKTFQRDYKINMPIVLDPKLSLTKLLKAKIAPQCFVIDKSGKIVYEGRIDDWYSSPGKQRTNIRTNDLDMALTNILQGKLINPVKTQAIGCIINK